MLEIDPLSRRVGKTEIKNVGTKFSEQKKVKKASILSRRRIFFLLERKTFGSTIVAVTIGDVKSNFQELTFSCFMLIQKLSAVNSQLF